MVIATGCLYIVTAPSRGKNEFGQCLADAFVMVFSSRFRIPLGRNESMSKRVAIISSSMKPRFCVWFTLRVSWNMRMSLGITMGTPKHWVEQQLAQGKDIISKLIIKAPISCDPVAPGARDFLFPPTLTTLRERFEKRNTVPDPVIQQRLAQAQEEMRHYHSFDYLVVNMMILRKAVADLSAYHQGATLASSLPATSPCHIIATIDRFRLKPWCRVLGRHSVVVPEWLDFLLIFLIVYMITEIVILIKSLFNRIGEVRFAR